MLAGTNRYQICMSDRGKLKRQACAARFGRVDRERFRVRARQMCDECRADAAYDHLFVLGDRPACVLGSMPYKNLRRKDGFCKDS